MLYDRQKKVNLSLPSKVCIVGIGGVGSWVALDLALVGVKSIIMIDDDTVDVSNLNRTPFRLNDIGKTKVLAMSELIRERRRSTDIVAVPSKYEDCSDIMSVELKDCEVLVDCRDTTVPFIRGNQFITGGYDGKSVTLHLNPSNNRVFDGTDTNVHTRYSVTPSYLVPPQFIANIITLELTGYNHSTRERVVTFNISSVIDRIFGTYKEEENE